MQRGERNGLELSVLTCLLLLAGAVCRAAAAAGRRPSLPGRVTALAQCDHVRCYAIRCKPGTFKDNLGQTISRDNDCFNTNPVVVTITDTCPCDKPNNAYSNKRWCCGDMDHFDIGVWAFKKFADPSKGVVQIEYMETPCGTDASSLPVGPAGQRASSPGSPSPSPRSGSSPNEAASQKPSPSPSPRVTAFKGPAPSPSPSPSPPRPRGA
ncbi:hypothetical protein V8C86DRAFT_3092068 [Haematococcus lacustris]